jgi:hypothetical protein
MASYEDSYKSQLQGVSQQVARERLDGQVSAQINMLSDAVTNLRRRPGAQYAFSLPVGAGFAPEAFAAWDTVVGAQPCQIILNSAAGVLYVLSPANVLLYTSPAIPYLQTLDARDICTATVGDALYFANTTKKPARGEPSLALSTGAGGFFYVRAGSFNKAYSVKVVGGTGSVTASYTTPMGTTAGDADLATAEAIAAALTAKINTAALGVTAVADGAYVFVTRTTAGADVHVSTEAGLSFLVASNAGYIRQESDLPAKLPTSADGWLVSTGDARIKRFYRFDAPTQSWLEAGDASSPLTLTNTPVALTHVGDTWAVDTAPFEGRFAGDDETNPDPEFVVRGVTGMAAYQGRLVLLAGNIACLSASNQPRRFYRTTVTSVLDSDAIGIGAAGATGATYRYAVPFQKDLVLFSDKNQAVIPGGNTAITPRTAAMLPTSAYAADMSMKPLEVGRSLMYSAPRSSTHFGIMEMLPSNQTDAQYTSTDATPHLPEYMLGRCRLAVSSTVSSMALFLPSAEPQAIIVHEYIWADDKKLQQAWHRWEFPFPVATAYFNGASIVLLFLNAGTLVGCTVEPKGGKFVGEDRVPFLDLATYVPVVARNVVLPSWLASFVPTDGERKKLRMAVARGPVAGGAVGYAYSAGTFTTLPSYKDGRVAVGFPFTSLVTPTPPMRKDDQGVKISTNKMTVLRFAIGTNQSGAFNVAVGDGPAAEYNSDAVSPLFFYSPELEPGKPLIGADSTVVVPARTRAEETVLTMSTDGTADFNLVGLEFVAQYHEKLKRARH